MEKSIIRAEGLKAVVDEIVDRIGTVKTEIDDVQTDVSTLTTRFDNVYTKTETDNRISDISQIYTTPTWGSANDNFNANCFVFDSNIVNVDVAGTFTIKVGASASGMVSTPVYLSLRDDNHGEFAKSTNAIVQSDNAGKYVTFYFEPVSLPAWFKMYFVDASGTAKDFRTACVSNTRVGITTWYGNSKYRTDICPAIGVNVTSGLSSESDQNDYLQEDITTTRDVGNVPAGAVFAKGTTLNKLLTDILAYQAPAFTLLRITTSSTSYTDSASVFCSSETLAIPYLRHGETNTDNVKDGTIAININGTTLTRSAISTEQIEISSSFDCTRNKSQWYAKLTGTNSLDGPMTSKELVLTAYMPVYCFVSPSQEESSVSGGLVTATAESVAYAGGETISKTETFTKGSAWCVALPSHMTMESIGTKADYSSGLERTSTTAYTLTRTVNGIADVPYTVYLLPIDTAQENLNVVIVTKAI